MLCHENRLLADDSHEISYLFSQIGKDVTKCVVAAVVIGALRVRKVLVLTSIFLQATLLALKLHIL